MPEQKRNYFSYLLRAWREQESSSWRFSLEGDFGKEKVHFSNFEAVVAYLSDLIQEAEIPGNGNSENGVKPQA